MRRLAPLALTVTAPLFNPAVVGLKVTPIAQVPPAASVVQLLDATLN